VVPRSGGAWYSSKALGEELVAGVLQRRPCREDAGAEIER
jgi:hypothetical protein